MTPSAPREKAEQSSGPTVTPIAPREKAKYPSAVSWTANQTMLPFAAVVSVEPNAALVVAEPVAATQWQYRGDDGWVDFDSDSCATLSTVVGETQLVIGERVYSVDAAREFQTNPVTGYRRAIRRAPSAPASARAPVRTRQPGAHAGRGVWEWQEFPNGPWRPYDRSTNAIILSADGRGEGSVVAATDGYRHNVDFGRGTAKDLTTGAIHAIRHSVDGVPVADAVAAPYVPTPELQRRVHELVRGMRPLHGDDALAYSQSLTPQQTSTRNNRNLSGWHKCVPVTCVGFPGCVYTYNFTRGPNEEIFCFPCFPLGFIAIPLLSCCCSSSEREQNAWISRDAENHEITGYIVIVDHERGTLAHYGIKCCSEHIEDRPACYCVKV